MVLKKKSMIYSYDDRAHTQFGLGIYQSQGHIFKYCKKPLLYGKVVVVVVVSLGKTHVKNKNKSTL